MKLTIVFPNLRYIFVVSNNEYLLKEEKGNIINGGAVKLHKLKPEKQPDT